MTKQGKKRPDPEAVAIGQRIRAARKAKRMTVEQLAEAAETSFQFLSKIEKGEQNVTSVKLAKLVRALGVSGDYILFGRENTQDRTALAAEYLGRLDAGERELLSRVVIDLQGLLELLRAEGE